MAHIPRLRRSAHVALALSFAGLAAGCGGSATSQDWTSANESNAGQRAATATTLDARTIPRLRVRWRFHLRANVTDFGAITSNPIIRGSRVYLQDSTRLRRPWDVLQQDVATGDERREYEGDLVVLADDDPLDVRKQSPSRLVDGPGVVDPLRLRRSYHFGG